MELDFTQDVRDAIEERRIPIERRGRVVTVPERTEADAGDSDLEHFLARVPEHGNRVRRVAANPRVRPVLVITAFFDRRVRDLP